ncbi:leucine-rich repeat-containing protein 52-like [Scyliorhinus canicula]|uniref:leucine-rich repeat-containing protein 52-like n=1 Tax=Scyliorhinus canicula TaxID=7830 RepID=UPI0018F7795B|nr:leucine-rich repeat-containing protein 52-like [Scyliorhinus canicula]
MFLCGTQPQGLLWELLLMGVMLAAACPPKCTCSQFKVVCKGIALTMFPTPLQLDTRHLDLSSNDIAEINSLQLSLLSDLVHLDCSHNKISEISELHFLSIVKLVYLDLSHNRLRILVESTFAPLTNLVILKLNDNKDLNQLDDGVLATNVGLQEIDLRNNGLLYLNTSSIRRLHGLKAVYLAGNPWECQCTISQLSEWIFKNNESFPDEANTFCTAPKSMVGIRVSKALVKIFEVCHTPLGYFDYFFFVIVGFAIFLSGIIVASLTGAIMVFFERKKKFTEDKDEIDMRQYRSNRVVVKLSKVT